MSFGIVSFSIMSFGVMSFGLLLVYLINFNIKHFIIIIEKFYNLTISVIENILGFFPIEFFFLRIISN